MSEAVASIRTEAHLAPYLRESPLFEKVSEVVDGLELQIFDTIPEAAREATPLVDALNQEAKETRLLGRAVRLKSTALHVPEVTLDPHTGEYTCRSKTADNDQLLGEGATRVGPFEGFMYTIVPISQDGESTNGFTARLCYQVDLRRTVSLPYISGNLCAYAAISSSELGFLIDEERQVADESQTRLKKLLHSSGEGALRQVDQLNEALSGDNRFVPATLRTVGGHAHDILDRLELTGTPAQLAQAKEALADMVKAHLWLTRNMSVKAFQVVHQYPSWLVEPHAYKFMGPQTVVGSPLDIGFTHHYFEVEADNRSCVEYDKEFALSFMFSQTEKDGTPVTVYTPLDKVQELTHL